MFKLLFGNRIICPYSLTEIRGGTNLKTCPNCGEVLPPLYRTNYSQHPPSFVQVFGWSRVGKTVYLQALTLVLMKMANVWDRFAHSPATEKTVEIVKDINNYLASGVLPPPTAIELQDAYIMVLDGMPRWGGRTLVIRDCPGEIFDKLEVPTKFAPYLLNVPTAFMFISLPDMHKSGGKTIDLLMTNYINTLTTHGIDFTKDHRSLVVVLTKGDIIKNLPEELRDYLTDDPIWVAINSGKDPKKFDESALEAYISKMAEVSDKIEKWIQNDAPGKVFVRLAKERGITLRFSVISSTGAEVGEDGMLPQQLLPRRVVDPYFWALDLQSR